MDGAPPAAMELVDWRRRVFDLYRQVRTLQESSPESAFRLWCSRRNELMSRHPQSPVPPGRRSGFPNLSYFDYNADARVLARVDPVDEEPWSFDASEGRLTLDCVGRATFMLFGEPHSLNLYWFRSYGGGLFLSFRDGTSGISTYGGCRYLLDTVKGADLGAGAGGLVLDFNFAYQPSCAYDPRWVCPLAPPGNRLKVEVNAGERYVMPPAVE